jgi:hypothetical protein
MQTASFIGSTHYTMDLCHGQIRHTQLFIVPFKGVHPEDGRRKQPKHVGVVSKQHI